LTPNSHQSIYFISLQIISKENFHFILKEKNNKIEKREFISNERKCADYDYLIVKTMRDFDVGDIDEKKYTEDTPFLFAQFSHNNCK
jgi:hypothetical protein